MKRLYIERSDGSQTAIHLEAAQGCCLSLSERMPESIWLIESGYGRIIGAPDLRPEAFAGKTFDCDKDLARWLRMVKKDQRSSKIVGRIVKRGNSCAVIIPSEIMKAMDLKPGDDIILRIAHIWDQEI